MRTALFVLSTLLVLIWGAAVFVWSAPCYVHLLIVVSAIILLYNLLIGRP